MKNKITSIEIINRSSGLVSQEEVIAEALKIYRTGQIIHLQYNGLSNRPIKQYDYQMNRTEINLFFIFLVEKIKIQDWEKDYSVPICDGWSWEFKMRYSNRSLRKVSGNVELPPRGLLLKDAIYMLLEYKVKPWIF